MKKFLVGCALSALAASSAYAQSTGSIDFEQKEVVITGTRQSGVDGVVIPQTSRTKGVLTSQFIQHTVPGQSINDTINMLPGVSFQNNDPFGSAGGTLSIRGFDSSRISQTFDGIPLNDTGNYAIYSNQQVDPELIEQVNVNLGTTDVDSPSAGASGSTVNIRTRNPTKDFHVRVQGSAGDLDFFRVFGVVDTGEFGPWGTRAFLSASNASNEAPYGHIGRINKKQINAKIYQPIGDNGDFVSVAGHYNKNRNMFFGSVPLRVDTTQGLAPTQVILPRVVGSLSSNRFPRNADERDYTIQPCTLNLAATPGKADLANVTTCGTSFDERYNPSNTGNVRVNSRFTLADGLVLTVDPSYQYVLANGGGTVDVNEKRFSQAAANGVPATTYVGYISGAPYAGEDLNGDGDLLDTVRMLAPSTTQTHRYGVIAGLRYEISPDHSVRVAYTLDYGRHRQTGEVARLATNGQPLYYFPRDNPLVDASGSILQKRDRLSYAILNQVSAEYSGRFFDALTVTAGIRAPFFRRELHQNCFTTSVTGFVDCFGSKPDAAAVAAYTAAHPYAVSAAGVPTGSALPGERVYKYNKILPELGFVYKLTPAMALHANYSKGLQVPSTDNLYNDFYYPASSKQAHPKPETTDNFDVGGRYTTSKLQAELAVWYTRFNNRLSQAYDPNVDRSVYTNLGRVDRYGVDGSVAYQPIQPISLYAFGSYLKSKIKDNVAAGGGSTYDCSNASTSNTQDVVNCFFTKGKRESYQPVYTVGGRIEGNWSIFQIGFEGKRTGRRYVNDQNVPVATCVTVGSNGLPTTTNYTTASGNCPSVAGTRRNQIFGAFEKGYTLFNLDARVSLEPLVHSKGTYFQLNVYNLFDKFYVGGSTTTAQQQPTAITNVQIGAPRAISGTLVVGF
jgi:iron complex outermembrane receptor protein